ncbi:hypothetical protein OAD63_00685 [Flavobacteriaceae bacterium]|nr:hypothetical protein [Flavobacteriaceae bacterium]
MCFNTNNENYFTFFTISTSIYSQTKEYTGIYKRHFDINEEGRID